MKFNFTNLKVGSLVEMELLLPDNNLIKLKTIVEEITDENQLSLFAPVNRGVNYPLHVNESFTLITVHKHPSVEQYDILSCRCKIISKVKEGNLSIIKIIKTGSFSQIQRRNYFRLPLIKTIEILFEDKKYELLSKDLSGNGIRGYMSKKIPADSECILLLDVESKVLELRFKVIECSPDPEHAYRYELRGSFINIKNTQLSQLLKYIFTKQGEAIKKQINLKDYVSILDSDQKYSDFFSMSNVEKSSRISPIILWALTFVEYSYMVRAFREDNMGLNYFFGDFTRSYKPELLTTSTNLSYVILALCLLSFFINNKYNKKTKFGVNIHLMILMILSIIVIIIHAIYM